MAVITITEILGGDNLAGSRLTLNDNFKKLANAINTIETRLDTSFNPGGSLNVGNALIRKYTNAVSAQIFTCEASALFQGNLNVSLDLGITKSINVGLDLNVSRNVVLDGAASGGGSFTSQVRSTFQHEVVNQQLNDGTIIAPTLNPQTLSGGTSRNITTVVGYSVLRLDLSTYSGNPTDCDTIILPPVGSAGCTPGQILTIIVGTKSSVPYPFGFQIDKSTLAPNALVPINITIGAGIAISTDDLEIYKLSVTLFADHNGWRVLNVTQPIPNTPGERTIIY
jgi:hypothetical protein